jgi:biotin transporter BioY
MGLSLDNRRRWLGIICMFGAVLMLLLGLTFFQNHMRPKVFIIYWLTCMLLTTMTMIIALLDLRAVRQRSRQEKSELARSVLGEFLDEDSDPKLK